MSTQHSPAPWKFCGDILRDGSGRLLYRLTPLAEITISQDDANRRLIEAAPDLCRTARSLTVMWANHDGTIVVGPAGWKQFQEVLAKLEGRPWTP